MLPLDANEIVEEMLKEKPHESEEPTHEDAEDAAVRSFSEAIKAGDHSAIKQHFRTMMDLYSTRPQE